MFVLFNLLCLCVGAFNYFYIWNVKVAIPLLMYVWRQMITSSPSTPAQQPGCLLPLFPEHGSYTSNNPASPGTRMRDFSLEITCDHGYKLTGPDNLGCWNHMWSRPMPTCRPFCTLRRTGPIVINRCVFPSGEVFNLDGDPKNGTETIVAADTKSETNESTQCTVPAFPKYGAFAIRPPLSPGDNATAFRLTAFCETGYELVGSSTIQCKAGRLTHPMPTCLPPCVPDDDSGAKIVQCEDVLNSTNINKASLTSANGISEFTVLPSHDVKNLCMLPLPPLYGSYTSSPVGSPGDTVESFLLNVACYRGYKLTGEGTVNCSRGVWMQPMPKCRRFCLSNDVDPVNTNKCVLPSGLVFRFNGVSDIKWRNGSIGEVISPAAATEPLTIESMLCLLPPIPKYGAYQNRYVQLEDGYSGYHLTIVCETGFELVGYPYLTCKSGRLEHPPPLCLPPCVLISDDKAEILRCEDTTSNTTEINNVSYTTVASDQTTKAGVANSIDGLQMCVLPPFPNNGWYRSYPPEPPGTNVETFQLNVTCNPGFSLIGEKNIRCIFGLMEQDMPVCLPYCKLEKQSTVSCGEKEERCALAAADEIILNTGSNYVYTGCGTVGAFRRRRGPISGGFTPNAYEFPWHTGIYRITAARRYEQICGGTIIARTVVISAAHCFTESRRISSIRMYSVAAGKRHRQWNDDSDIYVQKSTVKDIKIPPRYQGPQANFQEDIAIVITDSEFEYNRYVRPACISFDRNFDEQQLSDGTMGKIAGWGLTDEESSSSPILQSANIPSISIEQCIDDSPVSFRSAITADKICAGYFNGTSACRGDSGGGFVVPTVDIEPRYYLRGVISTSPANNKDCNIYTWITLTHILRHEHFIKSVLLDI